VPTLAVFELSWPVDTSNLLQKVFASADKVARKVLVNNCFGGEDELPSRVFQPSGDQRIADPVQCIKTLSHDLGAALKAHAAFVFVVEVVEFRLCHSRPLTQLAFAL
jgi:hypothetical protein